MLIKIPKHLNISYSELNDSIYIHTIDVDYKFRNQGIFKNFLNELSKEFKVIELECFSTLISMYKHLGFEDLGKVDEEYHLMRRSSD